MIILGLRKSLVISTFLLSACSQANVVDIRPYTTDTSAKLTPFGRAYESAKQHIAANLLGLAIVDLTQALAIDPRSVRALNAIGACYDDLHRYDVAKEFYNRALAVEPKNADTLNNMAVSLLMAGSRAEGEALLREAANLDASNKTIELNMAKAKAMDSVHATTAVGAPNAKTEEREPSRGAFDRRRIEDAEDGSTAPRIQRTGEQTYEVYVSGEPQSASGALPALRLELKRAESLAALPVPPVNVERLPPLVTHDFLAPQNLSATSDTAISHGKRVIVQTAASDFLAPQNLPATSDTAISHGKRVIVQTAASSLWSSTIEASIMIKHRKFDL